MALHTLSETDPLPFPASAPPEGDFAVVRDPGSPRPAAASDKLAALRLELGETRTRLLQERLAHSIQKAAAEQAYRVSESAGEFVNLLLDALAQPALQLSRDLTVLRWNSALAEQTGIAPACALGRTLSEVFTLDHVALLEEQIERYLTEPGLPPLSGPLPGHSPLTYTLLPLYRIPGTLEAVTVLFA